MFRQALFKEGARLEELILHRCDLAVVASGQFVVACQWLQRCEWPSVTNDRAHQNQVNITNIASLSFR